MASLYSWLIMWFCLCLEHDNGAFQPEAVWKEASCFQGAKHLRKKSFLLAESKSPSSGDGWRQLSADGVGVAMRFVGCAIRMCAFIVFTSFTSSVSSLRTKMIWRKRVFQCTNIKWMQPEENKKSWNLSSPNNCHLYLPYIGPSTIFSMLKHACVLFLQKWYHIGGMGMSGLGGTFQCHKATHKKERNDII